MKNPNEMNSKFETDSKDTPDISDSSGYGATIIRSVFGGVLMGLANLVPGISGGTMLLAAGIYSKFIDAIANITKFRFKLDSLLVLGSVVLAAGLAILLGAGLLIDLVVNQRWIMYSLFVGLTLGGVPMVWKLARPASPAMIISGGFAFFSMVALAVLQSMNFVGSSQSSTLMFVVAGVAGASAMILPGLSGSYILLLLGQYVPILSAVDQFKEAIKAKDLAAAMDPALSVVLPVGIGVVAGVVVVGNLVQWLLNRYRKATLGLLLGLLIGSTVGLWPFQQGVQPQIGQMIKGSEVTAENIGEIDPEDWPTQFFTPGVGQVLGALALVMVGFGITMGVARIGGSEGDI